MDGHIPSLAPGMSQTIVAGEEYVVKDDNGGEVAFIGRDRPWVVEFLTAFRNYMEVSRTLPEGHPILARATSDLRAKWDSMPNDLRLLLPSVTVLQG